MHCVGLQLQSAAKASFKSVSYPSTKRVREQGIRPIVLKALIVERNSAARGGLDGAGPVDHMEPHLWAPSTALSNHLPEWSSA